MASWPMPLSVVISAMSVKDTLAWLGIDPKKSLGQNFMVEPAALARLVDAANLDPEDAILEVGAGLGALTERLATRVRRLVAVEIDGRFIPYLEQCFGDVPGVEIVQADILEVDLHALLGADADRYKLVANLPYYITSPILRLLLEGPAPPRLIVVTVQHEVAQRMTAKPGDMNLLAVGLQFYGRAEIMARIKAGSFYPRPEVDSAIVRLRPHAEGPLLPHDQREPFFRLARAGFGQPRKQIKNSLAAGLNLEHSIVVNLLMAAGIDPRRRAETLSMPEWLALFQAASDALDSHATKRGNKQATGS